MTECGTILNLSGLSCPKRKVNCMSVRGLVTVVIGVVAFVVIDSLISNIITGTDTGSVNIMAL